MASSDALFSPSPSPKPNLMININTDFTLPHPSVLNEDDEVDVDDEDAYDHVTVAVPIANRGPVCPPIPIDESRKLFQRLWTDEDEIELLQGFLEYNTNKGNSGGHDTTAFYDQIKSKLQLDFNKNQLVEKLRRLKKKYRNVMQKIGAGKEYVLKSPHDQATFEISKKIWGALIVNTNTNTNTNTPPVKMITQHQSPDEGEEDDDPSLNNNTSSVGFGSALVAYSPNNNNVGVDDKTGIRAKKRPRVSGNMQFNQPQTPISESVPAAATTTNVIEETIRSCLSPVFKELLNGVMNLRNGARGVGGLTELATMPFGLGFGAFGGSGVDLAAGGDDEKWRNQQILELEVFSKRLELVQDRIKVQLEELRGKGS